jgi:hypothetical protein
MSGAAISRNTKINVVAKTTEEVRKLIESKEKDLGFRLEE